MAAQRLVLSCSVVLLVTGAVPGTTTTGHRHWTEDLKCLGRSDIELRIPVIAPWYDLCYVKPKPYVSRHGAFALARNAADIGWYAIVPEVTAFACRGRIIVGTCAQGYFIYDTRGEQFVPGNRGFVPSSMNAPEYFTDVATWRKRLKELAFPQDVHLLDPAYVAIGFDPMQLKPWEYRVMKGTFGLTDVAWSGIAVITVHLWAVFCGLFLRVKWRWVVLALVGGLLAGVLCDTLEPQGPAIATLTFPLRCLFVAAVAYYLKELALRARRHTGGSLGR